MLLRRPPQKLVLAFKFLNLMSLSCLRSVHRLIHQSSDLATQASSQALQSFDTPSPVPQSLSFRGGDASPRGRGIGGRGHGQRAGKVHSLCPSNPDLIENSSQEDTFSSPTHSSDKVHMESTSETIKRCRSGSDSSTTENSKAPRLKINRTFRNAQVDGHNDHHISSDDESEAFYQAGQSENLSLCTVASCSLIDSIASASNKFKGSVSVSGLHRLISQDICPNCHFFLEKMLLSSDPERVSFIMDVMP